MMLVNMLNLEEEGDEEEEKKENEEKDNNKKKIISQSPRRHKRTIRLHLPGAALRQDHGRQYDCGVLFKEL